MKFEMADDAMLHVFELTDSMLRDKLGPMVSDEVIRNTPEGTGALAESVEHFLEDHHLVVQAYGDELREAENRKYYAAWVDLGHQIVAWGNQTDEIQPPTAFMRRALYRNYPGF